MHSRDANVLRHIISYCNEIEKTIGRFGENYEVFKEYLKKIPSIEMPSLFACYRLVN